LKKKAEADQLKAEQEAKDAANEAAEVLETPTTDAPEKGDQA